MLDAQYRMCYQIVIELRAHYEQMAHYFSDYGHMALRLGEFCYLSVVSEEVTRKWGSTGQAGAVSCHCSVTRW